MAKAKSTSTNPIGAELNMTYPMLKELLKKHGCTGIGATQLRTSSGSHVSRYHCSCGWHGLSPDKTRKYEYPYETCPECGGKIVVIHYGSPETVVEHLDEKDDKNGVLAIKLHSLSAKLSNGDKTMEVVEDVENLAEYYKANGKLFTRKDCNENRYFYRGAKICEENLEKIINWAGEDVRSLFELLKSTYYTLTTFTKALRLVSMYPNVFTKENCEKFPELIGDLGNQIVEYVRSEELKSGGICKDLPLKRSTASNPIDSTMDLPHLLGALGLDWHFIRKDDTSIRDSWLILSPETMRDWSRTPIGALIINKHLHGSINMKTMMQLAIISIEIEKRGGKLPYDARNYITLYGEYDNPTYKSRYMSSNTVEFTPSERDCWFSFVKDSLDQYVDVDKLFDTFVKRIKTLREYGVHPTDESIRTKAFNTMVNSQNGPFRLVMGAPDFDTIDKDPIKFMEGLRLNEAYLKNY